MLSWSHIYLGRMLDLECKRDEAVAEYNQALSVRDGQQDTRLAAERGAKAAYVSPGHEACEDDSDDDAAAAKPDAQPAWSPKRKNRDSGLPRMSSPERIKPSNRLRSLETWGSAR